MDRNQVRVALLKISLFALAACSWVSWSFMFASRPEQSDADALVNLVRLPASLPSQIPGMLPLVKVMEPIAMDIVRVPCWNKADGNETTTSARWVRLTGNACQDDADLEKITVRNLSNGFSATVFPTLLKKDLTTDFIPLEAGRNEIVIRVGEGPESQFSFVRE